jgi:hypothetical protein
MRNLTILSALITVMTLSFAQTANADDAAIGTMAGIMIGFNHFPSDADKTKLQAIADSSESSEAEIVVATAIANIQHQATASDKDKLNAIVANEQTSDSLRELASVIVATNHSPSAADIEKLEMITSGN